MRMHNPPHPGLALREFLGDLTVTEAASRLRITRTALSRILNGSAGISADMALRLRDALGTSAEMWINMQAQYDLWQAEKKPRPVVWSFREPAHPSSSNRPKPAIRNTQKIEAFRGKGGKLQVN